jgi:hypothetical protein
MVTTLVYTKSPFVPFTKIVSADMNQYFTDIAGRLNWAGGTDAATGLGDDNIQSNTVSGGGLTRGTKLKAGTANYVVVNDTNGKMTDIAQLPLTSGGTGLNIDPTTHLPGDVLQVDPTSTTIILGPLIAVPASLRIFQFQNFT